MQYLASITITANSEADLEKSIGQIENLCKVNKIDCDVQDTWEEGDEQSE